MIPAPEPGYHFGVPFEEYCQWDAINQSSLKHAARSLAHYQHEKENPPEDDKDCFRFGRLCHTGKLEPVAALERYVVMPAFENDPEFADNKSPKATKRYKEKVAEFERVAASEGQEVVERADYDRLRGILFALDANPRARQWLGGDGPVEVSFVWNDIATGLLCKARVDKWLRSERKIPDLKTTQDASDFDRSCRKFFYHLQGAFYSDGVFATTGERHVFCPVAVEKTAPYGCRAAPMSDNAITEGRSLYRRLLRQIAEAKRTGLWPGYSNPDEWDVYAPPLVLTQGGEPFHVYG